jgi:hypothetical protein
VPKKFVGVHLIELHEAGPQLEDIRRRATRTAMVIGYTLPSLTSLA